MNREGAPNRPQPPVAQIAHSRHESSYLPRFFSSRESCSNASSALTPIAA